MRGGIAAMAVDAAEMKCRLLVRVAGVLMTLNTPGAFDVGFSF
jgi:hypothetical protein